MVNEPINRVSEKLNYHCNLLKVNIFAINGTAIYIIQWDSSITDATLYDCLFFTVKVSEVKKKCEPYIDLKFLVLE